LAIIASSFAAGFQSHSGLPPCFDELVDQVDRRLLLLVAVHDGAEHHFLGKLVASDSTISTACFGSGDDEIER
jgi:hypothetical protein